MNTESAGYFVTGTDTDIGKTWAARSLVRSLARRSPTTYMKPVQTGCFWNSEGNLLAPDYEFVAPEMNIRSENADDHVPYRFEPACSPHLAAEMAGVLIQTKVIMDAFRRLNAIAQRIIVEGAGGLYVPLSENTMMIDLISAMKMPVILVTSPRLGTLNHTFLSIEALRSRGLTIAGIMFNNAEKLRGPDFICRNNAETIAAYDDKIPFVEIPDGTVTNPDIERFCDEIIGQSV